LRRATKSTTGLINQFVGEIVNERVGKESLFARYGGEKHRQIGNVVDIRAVRKSETDVMLRCRTLQVIEIDYRVILFEKVWCRKRYVAQWNSDTADGYAILRFFACS
jgi:hypothetical protein